MNERREIEFNFVDRGNLDKYCAILNDCFPKANFSIEYLQWLYFENPNGKVIGFDAFDQGKLVGHYVCIPIKLLGISELGLLSLNTATIPSHRGMGLFGTLAKLTYDFAKDNNFRCVIGVANKASTKSFLRHLGFTMLGSLDMRIGFLNRDLSGTRGYSVDELDWRARSPRVKARLKSKGKVTKFIFLITKAKIPISAFLPLYGSDLSDLKNIFTIGITVDWQLGKKPIFRLPAKLKPSPLNLILKNLDESNPYILTSWSLPDFDAF